MEPVQSADQGLDALRRLRAELGGSMAALEQAVAVAAPGRPGAGVEQVHAVLLELADDVREHIALTEGPDGLHEDVVASSPRLAPAVERLARDHVVIGGLVADLLARTDPAAPSRDDAAIRASATDLIARLVRHRSRGADLIYEAFQADMGGET